MEYNKLIDHTALKPDVTPEAIVILCAEAKKYGFASVCVNPSFVRLAAQELKGTNVKVCTVIGFPLGATLSNVKVYETQEAVFEGATEIDMVINISQLKAKNYPYLVKEVRQIKAACHGNLLKVIIETCLLTDDEKIKACQIAVEGGADFVKTSTGFSTAGATVHDVSLMRKTVGSNIGVKASGGVRTHEDLLAMVEAGASRIGTSAGPKII